MEIPDPGLRSNVLLSLPSSAAGWAERRRSEMSGPKEGFTVDGGQLVACRGALKAACSEYERANGSGAWLRLVCKFSPASPSWRSTSVASRGSAANCPLPPPPAVCFAPRSPPVPHSLSPHDCPSVRNACLGLLPRKGDSGLRLERCAYRKDKVLCCRSWGNSTLAL